MLLHGILLPNLHSWAPQISGGSGHGRADPDGMGSVAGHRSATIGHGESAGGVGFGIGQPSPLPQSFRGIERAFPAHTLDERLEPSGRFI